MLTKPRKRKKGKHNFCQRLLNKINALPKEQKKRALMELELHEYCKEKEIQHTVLIRDMPHPLIVLDGDRYSRSGSWYMSGE
jgi:hypothetical protein